MTATCETCQFWKADVESENVAFEDRRGNCHRHAPRPVVQGHAETAADDDTISADFCAFWPMTFIHDWCGEHARREVPPEVFERMMRGDAQPAQVNMPELTCSVCGALENEAHKPDCTVVFSGISG